MLKSYEAIYDHGRIEWLTDQANAERFKMLVVVEQTEPCTNNEIAADALLAESFDAWGHHSITDVTAMIQSQHNADWGSS